MSRCRCADINNANHDLTKLKAARDYLGEAGQTSQDVVSDALNRLYGKAGSAAAPQNIFILRNVEGNLEQPLHDAIMKTHSKCVSKIGVLPGEIHGLKRDDKAYHDALAAKNAFYSKPR